MCLGPRLRRPVIYKNNNFDLEVPLVAETKHSGRVEAGKGGRPLSYFRTGQQVGLGIRGVASIFRLARLIERDLFAPAKRARKNFRPRPFVQWFRQCLP